MRVSLTRRVTFRATHRLGLNTLSEAENRRRFGETANPHPHDYVCDVTISGHLPPDGGLVDLTGLDRMLAERIVAPLDGQDLNTVDPAWQEGRVLVTCEALAVWCWRRLEGALPTGVELERVRVAEDERLAAECRGH